MRLNIVTLAAFSLVIVVIAYVLDIFGLSVYLILSKLARLSGNGLQSVSTMSSKAITIINNIGVGVGQALAIVVLLLSFIALIWAVTTLRTR